MKLKPLMICLVGLCGAFNLPLHAEEAASAAAAPHTLEELLRPDTFKDIVISPDGEHLAVTIPVEDRTLLKIVRRADMSTTMGMNPGTHVHVQDLVWANNERLLFSVAEKFGQLDEPQSTGEIFGTNVDGSRQELLFGYRAEGGRTGSRVDKGKQEYGSAWLLDTVPEDDSKVLISVWPWAQKSEPYAQVDLMDVYSGRRNRVALAPVQRASFLTDPQGRVRFATGAGADNSLQTWHRADDDSDWQLLNDERQSRIQVLPLGFAADGVTAYLQFENAEGPDTIYAWNSASGERSASIRGDYTDPLRPLFDPTGEVMIGALYMEGGPVMRWFDRKQPDALLLRILEKSFPGHLVSIDSATRDGKLALLHVSSDRSPGDYYLFEVEPKKADLMQPRKDWIDPRRTAAMQAVQLEARDGLPLHGYLTLPPGTAGKGLPLVVLPHGGPFGVADIWGYSTEVQLLAARGYAVLQVNFRGSGLHGRAHQVAGHRQWGKAMQDDLTDATRWAIEQGIADAERICIYGASYGGYAALMGAAKEPELYRCAAGYVGVYDLPRLYKDGDIRTRRSGRNFLQDTLGSEGLEATSPVYLADRIKVPVFLAAGGKDERAPVEHTEAMAAALERAGVPVEVLIKPDEGHGFFVEANKREYYERLVAFLDRHLKGS